MFDFDFEIINNIEKNVGKEILFCDLIDNVYYEFYSRGYKKVHTDRVKRLEREVLSNVESIVIIDVKKDYEQEEDFSYTQYYKISITVVEEEAHGFNYIYKDGIVQFE